MVLAKTARHASRHNRTPWTWTAAADRDRIRTADPDQAFVGVHPHPHPVGGNSLDEQIGPNADRLDLGKFHGTDGFSGDPSGQRQNLVL